jgi:hypothetical protein
LHGRHTTALVTRGAGVEDTLAGSGNSGTGRDSACSGKRTGGDSPSGLGYLHCSSGPTRVNNFNEISNHSNRFNLQIQKMVLPELQKNLKLGMVAANFKLNTFPFWPNIQISLDSELN